MLLNHFYICCSKFVGSNTSAATAARHSSIFVAVGFAAPTFESASSNTAQS